jgi:hypothetical protein
MRYGWIAAVLVVAGCASPDEQTLAACEGLMAGPYAGFAQCVSQKDPRDGTSWFRRYTAVTARAVNEGYLTNERAYSDTLNAIDYRAERRSQERAASASSPAWDGLIYSGVAMMAPRPAVTCVTNPFGTLTRCF